MLVTQWRNMYVSTCCKAAEKYWQSQNVCYRLLGNHLKFCDATVLFYELQNKEHITENCIYNLFINQNKDQ